MTADARDADERPSTTPSDGRPVVLFDLDGTLADAGGLLEAYRLTLRDFGIEPPDDAAFQKYIGPRADGMFRDLGVPEDRIEDAVALSRRHYHDTALAKSALYAEIKETLEALRPHCRIALATAKPIPTALADLEHHDLLRYFEVVGGNDPDGQSKSEIIRATLEKLGDPPRHTVIMVGDRGSDSVGARENGIESIAVEYGYGRAAEHFDPETHAAPHAIVAKSEYLKGVVAFTLGVPIPVTDRYLPGYRPGPDLPPPVPTVPPAVGPGERRHPPGRPAPGAGTRVGRGRQ